MKKWIFLTTVITISFFSSPAIFASYRQVKPCEASYEVSMKGISAGTVVRTLKIDKQQHYQFTSLTESSLAFINLKIFEASQGIWTQGGPQPHLYQYHYRVFSKKSDIISRFNWHKMIANTIKNGKRNYAVHIPNDAQDKISFQLALRHSLLNHAKNFVYKIVDKDDVNTYIFKKIDTETLKTPMGKIETIKMQRTNAKKDDEVFTFWLAPKYDYLLIKVTVTEDNHLVAEGKIKKLKYY